ncbi:hypothetical protein emb_1d0667 [Coriobacteriaceae bacterium EMTCatB1]|nr:hypothetical protein emb_1d0667 [Coriobacteriaceae bacterium EMTCatB1]
MSVPCAIIVLQARRPGRGTPWVHDAAFVESRPAATTVGRSSRRRRSRRSRRRRSRERHASDCSQRRERTPRGGRRSEHWRSSCSGCTGRRRIDSGRTRSFGTPSSKSARTAPPWSSWPRRAPTSARSERLTRVWVSPTCARCWALSVPFPPSSGRTRRTRRASAAARRRSTSRCVR